MRLPVRHTRLRPALVLAHASGGLDPTGIILMLRKPGF
jgi:hypothetical protein